MEIYVYVHNILKGDLPTRASGRERSGQSSVHFGEIGSIAGLIERNVLNAEIAAEKIKLNKPEFEIIKKPTIIYFD